MPTPAVVPGELAPTPRPPQQAPSVLHANENGARATNIEEKQEDGNDDEDDHAAQRKRKKALLPTATAARKVAALKRRVHQLLLTNPWKEAKKKKDAKMAELREKCVMELGLNKALDQHWKDCDKLLRRVDAKDSIFELERIRKVLISRFESRNVDSMEARYPGKRTRRDKKLLKADIDKLIEPVKDFDSFENLKSLYYGAAAMDMYQRHNLEMRKRAARKHREAYFVKERLRSEIRELETKVDRARREKWCAEDLHLWEPHRLPNAERKDLAIHGGPRSLDLFDERCEESSGMARLVHALQVSPVAYEIVSLGQTYSDAISKDF